MPHPASVRRFRSPRQPKPPPLRRPRKAPDDLPGPAADQRPMSPASHPGLFWLPRSGSACPPVISDHQRTLHAGGLPLWPGSGDATSCSAPSGTASSDRKTTTPARIDAPTDSTVAPVQCRRNNAALSRSSAVCRSLYVPCHSSVSQPRRERHGHHRCQSQTALPFFDPGECA